MTTFSSRADVVLPEQVLDKYPLPYLYSVRDHLPSLDRALTTPHRIAVPGHGPTTTDLASMVDLNRRRVHVVAENIVRTCQDPSTPEVILRRAVKSLGAEPADAAGFYLLQPTIFAFLTYLEDQGRLEHKIEDGQSVWKAT